MSKQVQQGPTTGSSGFKVSGAMVGAGVLAAALVTFMAQNTTDVRVSFLVFHFTLAVWSLTLATAVLGTLVWIGAGIVRRHRRRSARRAARD